jgi:2-polyprenyl-3-methyl-5-hydroxy-6-metoxy-1,4-benzoquinol methylase
MTMPETREPLDRRWRSGSIRVLDIAAGHGLFGIEIARQNPEAQIVALDWARVLEVAMANAHRAGVADRYETMSGSAFEVEFGGPYDAVLLTNFLVLFDALTCVDLLKKLRAALKPGGVAATPPMPAAFALTMLASTEAGDAYTFSDLGRMHREAGFAAVEPPLTMGPHSVVIRRR